MGLIGNFVGSLVGKGVGGGVGSLVGHIVGKGVGILVSILVGIGVGLLVNSIAEDGRILCCSVPKAEHLVEPPFPRRWGRPAAAPAE